MPTKATLKLVKSLQQKKYRKEHGLFVVEGIKSVNEFLHSDFKLEFLFALETSRDTFPHAEICNKQELQQISGLKTAPPVLAVFKQKINVLPLESVELALALDNLQDPGNLGTIIRVADWFGIKHIYCNKTTVDVYNPKVIQACMGSLTHVKLHYLELVSFLKEQNNPIYGTFMNGENIYTSQTKPNGIIVLGNEANGISPEIEVLCNKRIAIPQVGNSTESLNVAIATSICLSEFYRKTHFN